MKFFLVFTAFWLCSIVTAQQILQSNINTQTTIQSSEFYIVGELFNSETNIDRIQISESILQQSLILNVLTAEKLDIENTFQIYPNPVQNSLNVRFSKEQPRKMVMYSILGNEFPVSIVQNKIDFSQIPSGIYILKFLFNNQNSISKKIIKE